MKIAVLGALQKMELSLEHLIALFFEEPEIIFVTQWSVEDKEAYDLHITLSLLALNDSSETEYSIQAKAIVYDPVQDEQFEYIQEKTWLKHTDDKLNNKQRKDAIRFALLNALQKYTKIVQPWGTLTGVRPTKLMHQRLRAGVSAEQASQELQEQYLIQPAKTNLMNRIAAHQLAAIPDLYDLRKEVSIYIGIPYCPTKCAYCTFPAYAINGRQGDVNSFLGGLHYEMKQIGEWLKQHGVKVTTVYFGGGTPTSITAEEMDMLYERFYTAFPDPDCIREVTVEAGRPDTITVEKLEVLKKWGIQRISINPQSYIQETLKAIGRHHTVEETIEKFHLARSMGMDNINMDLIIGLPGEGLEQFQHTLNETEKLMPESLTVHTLSFKRASEMTQNKKKYKVADRIEVVRMMNLASDWANTHRYAPYYLYRQKNILGNLENVGYAQPQKESLYNILIMEEMQTIIGLGCGASTKWIDPLTGKITHFANPKEPKAYNDHYKHYTAVKVKTLENLFAK